MKKLLLLSFLFVTSISIAASTAIFDKLHQTTAPTPQFILKKIEDEYAHKAVIVEFELEFEHGNTTYEVTLYQAEENRFIELLVDQQGKLIELEYDAPEIDEQEEIAAAILMSHKGLTMQGLVAQLDSPTHQYLLEAQLEQDMGVTYMVATFITEQGRHKKAIDLATGKNLPLLRWGN